MTTASQTANARVLAFELSQAENTLATLFSGQIDAIVDADGHPYLLRKAQENLRYNERRLQLQLEDAHNLLSELKARHRRLAQENRAAAALAALSRERFLAVLVHELRTPLTPALLALGLLQNDPRFPAAAPNLAMIQRNMELQMRLLEDLVDFVTLGHGKLRVHLESIDAHQVIDMVLEICRHEIAEAHIQVVLELRALEHVVQADSVRLQQVLWNIVKNALKFSPPGGCITILSSNDAAGGLLLQFVDHGVGIEPEFLSRVFDPFEQCAAVAHGKSKGLGLGMFIAKNLSEAQQADLTVASEGHLRGTTFSLSFKSAKAKME